MSDTARDVMIEAAAKQMYERAVGDVPTWCPWDQLSTDAEQSVWREEAAPVVDAILAALPLEWGVRYPAGSVDPRPTEADARRWAICCNGLRPDLPLLVVRKHVTDWEVVTDA